MRFVPSGSSVYRSTAECTQCPSTTGARTAPGRNLECARCPQSGSGPHRQLDGNRWGVLCGRSCAGLRGARSRSNGGWTEAIGCAYRGRYLHLRACQNRCGLPQHSFRPTASQDLRNKHQDPNKQNQTQIPMYLQTTLEKNHGSGHFYLAKNPDILLLRDRCGRIMFRKRPAAGLKFGRASFQSLYDRIRWLRPSANAYGSK